MAQFIGFKCDQCSEVLSTDERHKVTTKIDGPDVQGEYVQDFCGSCVTIPPSVSLKPLRRRRTGAEEHLATEADVA